MAIKKKLTGEQVYDMAEVGAFGDNGHEVAQNMEDAGALVCRSRVVPVTVGKGDDKQPAPDEVQAIANEVWDLLNGKAYTMAKLGFRPAFSLRPIKSDDDETPVEKKSKKESKGGEATEEAPESAEGGDDSEGDPF